MRPDSATSRGSIFGPLPLISGLSLLDDRAAGPVGVEEQMANYNTRTVITDEVLLTEDQAAALVYRGAECYNTRRQEETVLDGIIHGRMPCNEYAVSFEEGWDNQVEDYEDLNQWINDFGHDPEDFNDEIRRLVVMEEVNLLHEILKVNPKKDKIEQQSAWTCSKMRLDGFGGSGLIITRKGYLYLTTSHFDIDEDGVVNPSGGFKLWEAASDV